MLTSTDILHDWDIKFPNRIPTVEEIIIWKLDVLKDISLDNYPVAVKALNQQIVEALTYRKK